MSDYDLAQLNIAVAGARMDSPVMADFVANLERINAVADAAPGFVWRLQTEDGDATGIHAFDDDAHAGQHVGVAGPGVAAQVRLPFRAHRGAAPPGGMVRTHGRGIPRALVGTAWPPSGLDEAKARLERLRSLGPGPEAFTFQQSFPPPTG